MSALVPQPDEPEEVDGELVPDMEEGDGRGAYWEQWHTADKGMTYFRLWVTDEWLTQATAEQRELLEQAVGTIKRVTA